ncbi:contact-dependent growth inhibition system immunity protein [Pseudomonas sp. GB2N2]
MIDNMYSQLFQFFGAYFNEDWMCEAESADDIVKFFKADSTLETVSDVQQGITTLLEMRMAEPELREFLLKNMSCCYCYWHEWASGEAWLNHVLNIINE